MPGPTHDDEIDESTFAKKSAMVNKRLEYSLTDKKDKLFPHQRDALLALKGHLERFNTALIVLPTGTGKTGVVALAPYVLGSNRVLVITPSEVISNQIYEAMSGTGNQMSFYEKINLVEKDKLRFFTPKIYIVSTKDNSVEGKIRESDLVITNAHKFGTTSVLDIERLPRDVFDLVIVDEAHHYPAPTWKRIVHHFSNSKRVFLTATPLHNNQPILGNQESFVAFELLRKDAVEQGFIRGVEFHPICGTTDIMYQSVIERMIVYLDEHDKANSQVKHQGMILARRTEEVKEISAVISSLDHSVAAFYGTKENESFEEFKKGNRRFLVVCGKCLEGFDQNTISVLGILRKVTSAVLFDQFVGRCVRRIQNENITSHIVSHVSFEQQEMFDNLDAEKDPIVDNDD